MKRSRSLSWLFIALAMALVLLAYPATNPATASPFMDRDPVQAAWRRAQESGVYHFSTTVVETTHPAPTLANVGSGSRQQRLYLEGETNLPERALRMMLWQNGGSVIKPRDGVEVRIEGDDAYGRQIGGLWQEIDNFSGAFAPGNDLMVYLAGARNVRESASQRVGESANQRDSYASRLTHYVFDFNGPQVAAYVRDQLEDHLREQGELPAGLHLDTPDQFREAIGEGEVWIDDDGLPLRLTIHLEYPQQRNGERVEADIQTDFSDFDRARLASAERPLGRLTGWLGLPRTPDGWRRVRLNAGMGLSVLGLLAFIVAYRKSKRVYAAFVVAIIFSMVVTPLLQSHQVYAFGQKQAARQTKYKQQQKEQKAAQEAQEALYSSHWNPHGDPLQIADFRLRNNDPKSELSSPQSDEPDPDSDDDGDGLTYAQEMRLGTDPDEKDSDGDQITDDVEVAGFWYSNKMWYLNPLEPDTNNDGQLDGTECLQQVRENKDSLSPHGICQDTDKDGVPDAFDRDNDDDSVPDRVDLSPFNKMDNDGESFDADDPLLLQVDDLEANKPVFVDFQLRPQTEKHLWYALNVLDWPSGDEHAQIQRQTGNDSTFADVAEAGQSIPANSDNGDVRLIPMLEIEIPYKDGHYGNLPVKENAPVTRTDEITLGQWLDTSKLVPYGVAVRPMNDDGDLVVYVPLNLVQDETGGDRVAFSARMLYWPTITTTTQTADWGLTQKVRVVWLVHMLTDRQDEDGEWVLDTPQVVRAYPEEWYLTGLAVREDHGLDVGITYEDPVNDDDLQYDDPLWALAEGLEASFVAGRDEDDDGERDITVAEIDARFSITSSATITERFGISTTIELETETYSYAHEDFIAYIVMTETKKILSDTFTSYVDQGADAVTLLFSQESRARVANLDGEDDTVTIAGHQLTLKLDQDAIPVQTNAYINWAPFRYEEDEWQSYPIAEYIDKLEVRLEEVFDEYKDEPNYDDILRGQLTVAKSYYLALYRGVSGLVQWGADLMGPAGSVQTDADLAARLEAVALEGGGWIAAQGGRLAKVIFKADMLFKAFRESYSKFQKVFKSELYATIGRWVKHQKGHVWPYLSKLGKAGFILEVANVVILVAVAIALFASVFLPESKALEVVLKVLGVVWLAVSLASTIVGAIAKGVQGCLKAIKSFKELDAGLKAGAVFLIIYFVITWGVFFYQLGTSGAKAGSLAANAAFASMVASSITTIILVTISAIPIVGQIIATLIFLIDAIAMWVCTATDSENWFCEHGGIQGMISEGITWLIYSANVMVNIGYRYRLDIEEFEQNFLDPDKGLSAGNSLVISATLENRLNLIKWKDTKYDWKAGAYWWQYSDKTLASSTFDYDLQANEKDIHSSLDRGDSSRDWDRSDGRPFTLIARANTQVPLEEAGINRTLPLYLAEGYAVPVQECWLIPTIWPILIYFPYVLPTGVAFYPAIPVCYVRTERDTSHINLGQSMYYDVFPPTLDEFYGLAEKDGGYALGWSPDSDPSFPRLKDADGDGLRNGVDDGADPDDHDWDTDNDGLSDFFELQQGSDPKDKDTDNDGLPDREEVILGSDPLRTDTDYDGLTDKEEVDGWEFVYDFAEDGSQLRTWVTSDPLSIDADLDELTDFQEKTFGFHPGVPSDPHVLTLDSQVREENAPHLLLRLDETEHASAFRDDSGYANNGTCEGDGCPAAGHYGKYGNAPHFDGVNDTITVAGANTDDLQQLTVAAWVNLDSLPAGKIMRFVTLHSEKAVLRYDGNNGPGQLHFYVKIDGSFRNIRVDNVLQIGTWQHVAGTYDGETMRLYLDGQEIGNYPIAGTVGGGEGVRLSSSGETLEGFLDEVLIFDRALSQPEIEELMAGQYNTADHTVQPGDPLYYRASVKNELFNRYAQGLLSVRFPAAFSEIPPVDFILNPMEGVVLTGTVTVAETAATGVYSLTQEADALIENWREISNYADMLLHLDEVAGATTFEDSSGSQPPRDGVCDDGADQCPTAGELGQYGYALHFDGVNDTVTVDHANTDDPQALTIAAWVKPDTLPTGQVMRFITLNGEKAVLRYDGEQGVEQLHFYMKINGALRHIRVDNALETGVWQFVAGTYDGSVMRLYLNGQEIGNLPIEGTVSGDDGLRLSHPTETFHGLMDEVNIFPRGLSPLEIQVLYNRPVLRFLFDEAAGVTKFVDASGFENDGLCGHDWNTTATPEGTVEVKGECPSAGVEGISGQTVEFGGGAANTRIRADSVISDLTSNAFSAGCFFKINAFTRPQILFAFSRGSGWPRNQVGFRMLGKHQLQYYDPGVGVIDSGAELELHRWYHAMLVIEENDTARLYLDGEEVKTFETTIRPPSDGRFTLGQHWRYDEIYGKFSGYMDNLVVYNFAISPDQVRSEYQTSKALYLRFDDAPGVTAFHDLTGQNNVPCSGEHCPTAGVPGRVSQAVYFDGQDDYIEVEIGASESAYALSLWFKTTCADCGIFSVDDGTLGSDGHDRDLYLSGGNLCAHVWQDETICTSGAGYADGTWHHAVHTFGGAVGGQRIYVDGAVKAQGTKASSDFSSQTGVNIGFSNVAGNPYFSGCLDDLRLYRRALYTDEIQNTLQEVPQLILHLDETIGATQFEDDSGNGRHGSCTGDGCPKAGVKGQMGLAADFDGVDDLVTVPNAAPSDLQQLTLMAWVKPETLPENKISRFVGLENEKAVLRYDGSSGSGGTGQLHFYAKINGSLRDIRVDNALQEGYWYHVTGTYDGETMRLYINGNQAGSLEVPGTIADGATLYLSGAGGPLDGRLDEVTLYERALSSFEVYEIFRMQAKWVEERQSTRITVDDDEPTSTLVTSDTYRLNQDVILLVSAADDTSPVTMVELGVSTDGGAQYTWESAPRCQDANGDAAWCPTFEPTIGEGRYLLQTRATDGVGNVETPAQTYTFLVDGTPPDLDTALQAEEVIQATSTSTNTWLVSVSGTVSDPTIAGTSEPGSGVDTVLVRLTATAHPTDTMTPRTATLDGADWEADFSLPYADATGWYTLSAQATDKVGNVGPFVDLVVEGSARAAQAHSIAPGHRAHDRLGEHQAANVGLDTSPPVVSLDPVPTSLTTTITTTLTLTGLVSETGVVSAGVSQVEIGFVPGELTYVPTYTVAMYRLDDPPGSVSFADESDSQIAATCVGTCFSGQGGAVNQAVRFYGNDMLTITEGDDFASPLPERDLSVVAWVRITDNASPEGYVSAIQDDGSFQKGWAIGQVDDGGREFFFALSSEGADDGDGVLTYLKTTGINPYQGQHWYHVAATYDGAAMRLYVNGELEAQNVVSQSGDINYPSSGWFAIGSFKDDNQNDGHHGYMDEVAVFDRVLSAGQIRALYGAGGGIAGENVLEWDDTTLADSGDGVLATTWAYTLPEGFDGMYQINLRGSDVMGNVAVEPDWDSGWDGEIDTLAPRVKVTAEEEVSYLCIKTTYTCWAQDFNLVWMSTEHPEYNFKCPCQTVAPHATVYTPTYYHEASLWYHDIITNTNRLYELEATCTVLGPAVGPDLTMRAYDIHGRYATDSPSPSQIPMYKDVDSAVLTPTLNTVITSTDPISLTGRAYASHGLKEVEVTVDGNQIDKHTWTCSNVTDTQWASTWWAPTEGVHTLNSRAIDCNDQHQPVDHPIKVIVDIAPPFVGISPTVLTTTHRLSQGRVRLSGPVSDTNGIGAVQVSIDGGDWQDASFYGGEWRLDWYLGEEPAGKQYTVTARATDVAGHTTRVTSTEVTVDLERPNPITLTLTLLGGGDVITPGLTLRTVPSVLDLTWVTSTSRADMLPYEVVWTIYTTQTNRFGHAVPVAGTLVSQYTAWEAQRIVPSVTSRFTTGNRQVDTYGSVYVDTPLTPDYITLETAWGERRPYLGWMESGCSRIGVDRRTKRNAPGSAAIDDLLELYATWDSEALRLVWTGANWDYAGDLFIYLNTTAGGALRAYNPFTDTGGATVDLPGDAGFADFLVWVEDSDTAHLLTWDVGNQKWDFSLLSPDEYRFDEGLHDGHTDLYLPFDMLDIDEPATTPLAMVAFATEEDSMLVWGAMPPANPLNSARVVETLEFAPEEYAFGLTQFYFWPLLAPSVCPNNAYGDADVQVGISADPPGSTYGFLGSDLFWLWKELIKELITDIHTADLSESFTFMDVEHPPVGDGDTITYTLHYINQGSETATDVKVVATPLYALSFGMGVINQVISLGDIAPGQTGRATFQGQVDPNTNYNVCLLTNPPEICEPFHDWAVVQAVVIDNILVIPKPLDWLWADHRVDSEPPEFFDIQQPEIFINAGDNTFRGYAYDESGVPILTLGVQSPFGTTTCPDADPDDGVWSCEWNAGGANDGVQFNLQLQATDGYGQDSVWTNWRTFIVDAVPPTITFSAETTLAYSDTVVGDASLTFSGLITDNRGIADVEVCLKDEESGEEKCGSASVQATGAASFSRVYTDALSGAIGACGGGEIVRTFVVTDNFTIGEVRLGFNAGHARRNDILATLTSPANTSVQVLGPKEGTPPDYQNYDVLLYDAATAGLHEFKGDDDTAEPYFDRDTRPYSPMRVFRGENSAGTWTLNICDTYPITYHGVYSHSQLVLKPQNTAAQTGNWSYIAANLDELDDITHTLEAYAIDLVGNRSEPISLTFEIDNVAPSLEIESTVELTFTFPNRAEVRILAGDEGDGGRIVQMYAFVQTPAGDLISLQVGRGASWWFDLEPDEAGDYTIWINAIDAAGNATTAGPAVATIFAVPAGSVATIVTPEEGNTPGLVYTDTQGMTTTVEALAGAVGETIVLLYTPLSTPTQPIPSSWLFANHAFNLAAYRGIELLSDYVFAEPISITIHYTDTDVIDMDEEALTLYHWDGNGWADAACGAYDRHPDENWLAVPVCHLTPFALSSSSPSIPIGGVTMPASLWPLIALLVAVVVVGAVVPAALRKRREGKRIAGH